MEKSEKLENKVDVVINGEVFKIKSNESVEYLQKLAHYTGKQIEEITQRHAAVIINERVRTLLIALNIANDYFKVKPELDSLKAKHKQLQKEHTDVTDENIKLTEQVKNLQRQIEADKIVPLPFAEGRKALG
jgi:cell division protein ZapA